MELKYGTVTNFIPEPGKTANIHNKDKKKNQISSAKKNTTLQMWVP